MLLHQPKATNSKWLLTASTKHADCEALCALWNEILCSEIIHEISRSETDIECTVTDHGLAAALSLFVHAGLRPTVQEHDGHSLLDARRSA